MTAVELGEPDMVPVSDLDVDSRVIEKVTGVKMHGSGALSPMAEAGGNWQAILEDIGAFTEAHRKLDFDAVVVSDYRLVARDPASKNIGRDTFVDEWGRVMKTDRETGITWWVGGTIETEEDLEGFSPPDVHAPGREEILLKIIKEVSGDMAVGGAVQTGFVISWMARGGLDKMIVDMYRRPAFVRSLMAKYADVCLEFARLMISSGIDFLFLTDDYCDTHGPILNHRLFMEFELPYLKRILNLTKSKGVPVLKHTDGNVLPILDELIEAGIRGLNPIEPECMDIGQVKQVYGDRISLMGNVDCKWVLPYGTEEDVRRDVRRVIDAAGEGGGLVLSSSNTLHPYVNAENVYTMVDEARRYGKYPLKRAEQRQSC